MNLPGWRKALVLPLMLVLAARVAAAPLPEDSKTALTQVPATAPVVVHVHGIDGTAQRLITYVESALPDLAPIAKVAIQGFLANGIEGRKFRGLAKDGPIFFVLTELPKPGEMPPMAIIAATTSYKEFRDNILTEDERKNLKKEGNLETTTIENKPAFFLEKKGYVVMTPNKEVALALAKNPGGLDAKVSREQSNRLLASDFGVYVNMTAVNKEYAEQIKDGKKEAEGALDSLNDALPKNQRAAFEAGRKLLDPLFQAIEDSTAAMLTVEFRPGTLVVHFDSLMGTGTKTATMLKDLKSIPLADIDRMPPGSIFYTGMMMNADIIKLLGPLASGTVQEPESAEAKTVKKALDELASAGPGARVEVSGMPVAGLQVWSFADPKKALAAQLKILDNIGKGDTFAGGMLKQKAAVKKQAAKYKSIEFSALKLEWDVEKMAELAATNMAEDVQKKLAEAFKKIVGTETTIWVGADAKGLVTVTAADWKTAEALLGKYFNGDTTINKKEGYRQVRKELPPRAVLVEVLNVVAYGTGAAEIVKPMIGQFINLPEKYPVELPKENPSFIGMAVTAENAAPRFRRCRAGLCGKRHLQGVHCAAPRGVLEGWR